jgi:hypothetical protein
MRGVRAMPRTRIANSRTKYVVHKAGAKRRGIAFELTFEEWLTIWEASDHFEERGRKASQYHMARHNDTGAYAAGNVKIITASQNIIEIKGRKGRKMPPRSEEHMRKISEANTGKKASAETRRKLSAVRLGVKMNLSPEERLRRSARMMDLNNSSGHRAKLVAARWPHDRLR